jgi:hypothetical protein
MLQHEDHFHDDVKLVLVYSLLTRAMLKNLQRSPIGKANFPALMAAAFSWFSQLRQKELLFTKNLPPIKEFVDQTLTFDNEFDSEMMDSIAELTFYIITHAQDANLHETIAFVTNQSYRKCELRKAWTTSRDSFRNTVGYGQDISFEDWYKEHYNDSTK